MYLLAESLDLLERIAPGVTEPLIEQSRSWTQVRTTFRAKDVYVRKFPAAPPGKFGISVAQPAQEKVLFDRCRHEGVEFRWSHPVAGVSTDSDGVTLEITGGEPVRARYVIASDGARSAVRSGLGIELDGTRSNTAFVIVDLAANVDDPGYNERAFHYQHPTVGGRNVLVVPFGGGLHVDLQCSDDDDVESLPARSETQRVGPRRGGSGLRSSAAVGDHVPVQPFGGHLLHGRQRPGAARR